MSGALVQEVIDVLAIGNALRVLGRARLGRRPVIIPDAWTRQLDSDHDRLRVVLGELRTIADHLDGSAPARELERLRALGVRVRGEILVHERIDEAEVYPSVARHLGGSDPLAAMSRAHQEIFHLAALLERLTTDAGPDELGAEDRGEAGRILYALDAILGLHLNPEEELLVTRSDRSPTAVA